MVVCAADDLLFCVILLIVFQTKELKRAFSWKSRDMVLEKKRELLSALWEATFGLRKVILPTV